MNTVTKSLKLGNELSSLQYLQSLIPAILAIIGNILGGYFTLMNVMFPLVFLVLADWLLPVNTQKPKAISAIIPDSILLLTVLAHTLAVFTLIYGTYTGILENQWKWFAVVATGFNSGILGITSAHELIHRKEKWMRQLGIWNLFLANYTHFYIEHRLGHHLRVGTWDDPATSRYNESYYQFLIRAIPGQWFSALTIETKRLQKKNSSPYSLRNFVIRALALQILFMLLLAIAFGIDVFLVYFTQATIAFVLLEFVNYIEHYGLVRSKGEKVTVHHSWQSDAISSRFTLFELSRHSDHHLKAYKPYYTLESHEESYVLPSGYFGMFYIGLIPPLWFKIVNPILDKQK